MIGLAEPKRNDRLEPYMVRIDRLHHGPKREQARLWVKVNFIWISRCSRVGIHKQLPSPTIIPSNAFVDDKVVVFLV